MVSSGFTAQLDLLGGWKPDSAWRRRELRAGGGGPVADGRDWLGLPLGYLGG